MYTYKHIWLLLVLLLLLLAGAHVQAAPTSKPQANLAPTYRIFATREGLVGLQTANGHIIQERDHFVALPSWQVLSSYRGSEFQVRITYQGRTTIASVWDVGPWNTNDRYWSPDRGDWPDLPIGMPQAQAAYFDGYNGGLDEFGRVINNPNGIDIADGTYWDALGMTRNDWVEVSFLWLGQDPGPGAAVQAPIPPPPDAPAPNPPPEAPASDPPPDNGQPAAAPAPPPTTQPLDNPIVEVGAIAVDDVDPEFEGGTFAWDDAVCGLNGAHTWATSQADTTHQARWLPLLDEGAYEIKVYIPDCGSDMPLTTSANYTVFHDNGKEEITIDQAASTGQWVSLGSYHVGRDVAPLVELSTTTDDIGSAVRFDAIAWLPSDDDSPPQSQISRIARRGNGYVVEWSGEDDTSGIVGYDLQVRQLPRGNWRTWGNNQAGTSAWWGPDEGKHFAFRVRARDFAGNEEAWPPGEDGTAERIMDTYQAEEEEEQQP